LLRVAAGADRPDSGVVLFEGRDLGARGSGELGRGVGYCQLGVGVPFGRPVIDKVRGGLLARRVPGPEAYARAHRALERVGVERHRDLVMGDLDGGEAVRVAIACAIVFGPRVLVIDEPTKGVDLLHRDEILLLLRSLANEGTAILMSDGDGVSLSDADRSMTLMGGKLRGKTAPEAGSVVQLLGGAGKRPAA
jgi:energy-coupling factor transporter ATP-binding protein EcfA2